VEVLKVYIGNYAALLVIAFVLLMVGVLIRGMILGRLKPESFEELFYALFVGTIASVTLYAIFSTSGVTIMAGYLLLGGLFYYEHKKIFPPNRSIEHKDALSLGKLSFGFLLLTVFVFTWCFVQTINGGDFLFHVSDGTAMAVNDHLINAFRAYNLGANGQENYYHVLNELDPDYHGSKAYHYFEMWLNSLVTSFIGGLNAKNLTLLVNPILLLTSGLGLLAFLGNQSSIKYLHWPLVLGLFFIAGFHLPFYSKVSIPDFSLPIFTPRLKMLVYYNFIIAAILAYRPDYKTGSILFLLGLCLATIVAVPAILGGIILAVLIHLIKVRNREHVLSLLYTVLIGIFIVSFYTLFDHGNLNIRKNASLQELSTNFLSIIFQNPLALLKSILISAYHSIALYIPAIILFFLVIQQKVVWGKKNSAFIILFGSILITASVVFAIFQNQKDANQLFYNIAFPIMNVGFIMLVVKLLSNFKVVFAKNKLITTLATVMLMLVVVKQSYGAIVRSILPAQTSESYSENYLLEIQNFINAQETAVLGASIKGGTDYKSQFSKQTAAYTLGYYLSYMRNGCWALQMSDFDIPNIESAEDRDVHSGLFYRFVEDLKRNSKFNSIGNAQKEFLSEYGLSFIIVSAQGKLRKELQPLVNREIKDELSGERFLILKDKMI